MFPLALAAAVLVFDPLAPAAVVKAPAVTLVAVVTIALGWKRWRLSLGGALFLILAGFLGLSLAWSAHPAPLELGPWLAAAALTLPLAGMNESERRGAAGTFALAFVACAGAAGLMQWLRGAAIHGGQGNANGLGLALAVSFPLAWDRAAGGSAPVGPGLVAGRGARGGGGGQARALRYCSKAAVALGAVACALAESRAAWVGLAAAVVLFARGRWRLASLPLVLLLGYALWRGDLAGAAGGRLWIARASARAALQALPFGAGLGSFPFAYLDAQGQLLAALDPAAAARQFLNATSAHDDWLELLVDGGIVAPALAIALFFACVGGTRWRAGRITATTAAIAAIGDSALALPAVAIALAFVAADTPLLARRKSDRVMAGAALAALALLLPATVRRHLAERTLHATLRRGGDTDTRARGIALAASYDDSDGEVLLARGLVLEEQGDPRARDLLARSRARLANVGTSVAIGNSLLAHGRPREAADAYREALALDPGSFRARLNLIEALRRARDFDAADHELAIARKLQPNHPKLARIAERLRRDRIDAATEPVDPEGDDSR